MRVNGENDKNIIVYAVPETRKNDRGFLDGDVDVVVFPTRQKPVPGDARLIPVERLGRRVGVGGIGGG